MASLFRLNLAPHYALATQTPNPHASIALQLSRWLNQVGDTLASRGYPFESGDAIALSTAFTDYAHDDGTPDGFITLWQDMEDWAGTIIYSGPSEKTLCALPPLPSALEY